VIDNYIDLKYKEYIQSISKVIPNGVDKFWLLNMNNKNIDYKNNSINIVYVGSIDKNKNIIATIKAIDILITKGYDIRFDIIGNGKYIKKIRKLIDNNRKYIKLHGYKSKEDILSIYRKSDIFVMPSKHETFGLVYVEALTQGIPIIYTKKQGFDGFFED